MEGKNILLAGLPAAGKSTYITALWAVEKDGKSGHLLSCDCLPSESSYIDGMRDKWMVFEKVRRTSFAEPQEILLTMKCRETSEKIGLLLPDFKGEVLQRVLDNDISDSIREWCEKAEGILFMLNIGCSSPEIFQEQVSSTIQPKVGVEKAVMSSSNITPVIQNVLLLKFFRQEIGDCPIAICFSCWDIIDNAKGCKIEEWVMNNHPSIYNFVEENFSHFRYFGVSAQGVDYVGLTEENTDDFAMKTTNKERAYVFTDKKSFDITEPINFIISEENED